MNTRADRGAYADVWRRVAIAAAVFALLAAASYAVAHFQRLSGADRGYLSVAGDVRVQSYVVRAPILPASAIDVTVGLASAPGAAPAPRKAATPQSGPSVSGLIAEVYVAEGDRVVAGQELARLDARLLELGVQQAETAAEKARADIGVLGNALDTIADNEASIAKSKRDVTAALAKAKAQRADLAAQLKQIEKMPMPPGGGGSMPPTGSVPPTGSMPPPGTPRPDPAALIAKLKAGLAQIDAGIAKMQSGLAKMATGSTKLADAKTQVTNGRELLTLVADARDVETALAKARVDSATLVSPVDGLVTFARRAGTVAMVNAPLFRIAPETPALIDTYLTADQLARVRVGDRAEVSYDSAADIVLSGKVTAIGDTSAFPPTPFPTEIVHMTRTTRVTITLTSGAGPPAGTPVDITIRTDSRG